MRSILHAILIALAAGCAGETLGGGADAGNEPADAARQPDARPIPDAPIVVGFPDAPPGSPDATPLADAPRPPDAGGGGMPDAMPTTNSCFTAPGATSIAPPSSTIYFAESYAGATDVYKFNSNQCSDAPDSAERIYTWELSTPTEIHVATRCGTSSTWDCEVVVTRNGCTDPNVVTCQTTVGDEDFGASLQAGKYALFLEGDNPADPAIYDLMINFNHTGGQAGCAATAINPINAAYCEDPFDDAPHYHLLLDGEFVGPGDIDDFFVDGVFGCTHDQNHVGGAPDKVYALTLDASHRVRITLIPHEWDGILYVTGAPCGARGAVVDCSDDLIGSEEEIDTTLAPGTWYIVVDGFGPKTFDAASWGTFDLDVKVYDDYCNQ